MYHIILELDNKTAALTMLDNQAKERFIANLPPEMRRIMLHLESQEEWVQENDPEVVTIINDLGKLLTSYQRIEKLRSLPTDDLVKLLICVSITRYFSFFSEMSNFRDYSDIIFRVHNDISHEDAETENFQRTLISRLQSVVRLNMLAKVYSEERITLMKEILKRPI